MRGDRLSGRSQPKTRSNRIARPRSWQHLPHQGRLRDPLARERPAPQQAGFRTKTEARRGSTRTSRRGSTGPDRPPTSPSTRSATCSSTARASTSPRAPVRPLERVARTGARAVRHAGRSRAGGRRRRHRPLARQAADDHARYKTTPRAAAGARRRRRWRYIARNPASTPARTRSRAPRSSGRSPATRSTRSSPSSAPRDGALVIFAAETGLRTNEWTALERRDIDRRNPAVAVAPPVRRRRADAVPEDRPPPGAAARRGRSTRSTSCPPRIDTPLLFPAPRAATSAWTTGGPASWYPALDAAGIARRGPYHLRHTFATEALAAGVSIFQLARLMGASSRRSTEHYGHLAHDSEEHLRGLLDARSGVLVASDWRTARERVPKPACFQAFQERERRDSNPRPPA